MADVIITTDTTTGSTLTSANDIYFLQEGVLHYSTSGNTLDLGFNADGGSAIINGTITAFSDDVVNDTGGATGFSYTVGATGSVITAQEHNAFDLSSSLVLISNFGVISGGTAIDTLGGDNQIYNAGIISSNYAVSSGSGHAISMLGNNSVVVNDGQIIAEDAFLFFTGFSLTNNGSIIAGDIGIDVLNSNSNSVINNTGIISSGTGDAIDAGTGSETVHNSGTILGDVDLSSGLNEVINSSVINGNIEYTSASAGSFVENSGQITGEVFMSGSNSQTVINSGTINLSVDFGSGNDTYIGAGSGIAALGVFGADGDDSLRGSAAIDQFDGGNENDYLSGLGGSDELKGGAGDDTLFGGIGDDVLEGGDDNDFANGGSGDDIIVGGSGNDTLAGVSGDDDILGGAGIDEISGGSGADTLSGDADNDVLRGGAGDDEIIGGAGRDRLFGNGGDDTFIFNSVTDSGLGAVDKIYNFRSGQDLVDIDALSATDIEFAGTGGHTGGGTASVRYITTSLGVSARVDADGNGSSDMFILMLGTSSLSAEDFVL